MDYTKFAFYRVGFATLPLHIHEVFIAYAGYQSIYSIAAPILSKRFAPKTYNSLPAQRKVNWNAKVTSMIQSTLITSLALYVIASDKERKSMDWTGRIWGYTGAMGMVQALAGGYFIWDLLISLVRFDVLGIESLAHAVSALLVTSIGFVSFERITLGRRLIMICSDLSPTTTVSTSFYTSYRLLSSTYIGSWISST